jgi:hypothetical protein
MYRKLKTQCQQQFIEFRLCHKVTVNAHVFSPCYILKKLENLGIHAMMNDSD